VVLKDEVANSFRRWGYLQADLDPLGRLAPFPHSEIDEIKGKAADKWRAIYCSKVGAEFMYMPFPERCSWVASRLEAKAARVDQKRILKRILSAESFERFIHTRYVGTKRFSLEGIAAVVPLLDSIFERAADHGFETVLLGMAHRGRLTMLVHVANIPASKIFACFEDVDPRSVLGSGDVKYHKGATGIYECASGKQLRVHMVSNPSHLEAVNPVLMGRVRAKQQRMGDTEGKKVLAVLLHGDAAFAGQGVTAEALNFATLPGFSIGGTVHIIVNNLIGFTAVPQALHSSRFSSDIAKRLSVPILHVNGESPDDVVRAKYSSDVVVDLIAYRRYGHNEADDPTVTSPQLYEQISSRDPLFKIYAKEIGVGEQEVEAIEKEVTDHFSHEQEAAQTMTKQPVLASLPDYWNNFVGGPYDPAYEVETAVTVDRIKQLGTQLTSTPDGFTVHPKLKKLLDERLAMSLGKKNFDWGAAEAFAFGSLLQEGAPIRVVGQDSRRGTFSHRHAVLYDYKDGKPFAPLSNVNPGGAWFEIYDSQLSEAAAVGYEYGFSRDYPEALVAWEAQFGDFANGAQIILDQFVSAGEDKWSLLNSLVLLLPHGFEGQGPEHSSARIERFLQLAGEDNMQVCYPSTSGQYFHLLRRQVRQSWRKPLVVFTPKSMLRAPVACSPLSVLTDGKFQNVLDDNGDFTQAKRLLIGSGKIVHQLRTERQAQGITDVAIISIEQLYPFPEDELIELFQKYSEAEHVIWVQEEPANMGALFFVRPLIERLCSGRTLTTVKRSSSASPATGSYKAHELEQQALIKLAFAKYS
jgi:2-oxoglutarate dehydrogenase E1 component